MLVKLKGVMIIMAIIKNNIYLYNEYAEVEIIHKDYRANVIIDIEDVDKISKLRLTKKRLRFNK